MRVTVVLLILLRPQRLIVKVLFASGLERIQGGATSETSKSFLQSGEMVSVGDILAGIEHHAGHKSVFLADTVMIYDSRNDVSGCQEISRETALWANDEHELRRCFLEDRVFIPQLYGNLGQPRYHRICNLEGKGPVLLIVGDVFQRLADRRIPSSFRFLQVFQSALNKRRVILTLCCKLRIIS